MRIQSVPLIPRVLGTVGLTGKAQAHLTQRFCSTEMGDVILGLEGETHDVQGDAHVHAFLLPHQGDGEAAVGKRDGLVAVAQRAGEGLDSPGAHEVEMDAGDLPALGGTDPLGEQPRVVVGEGVAEGLLGGIEEVLAIEEGEGPLDCRFSAHGMPGKKEPRQRPEG
jgi:hypothetical protein